MIASVFKLPKSFPSFPRLDLCYQFPREVWPYLLKVGDHTALAELRLTACWGPRDC